MQYGIYYAYWERQWGVNYLKYVEKVKKLGFDILEISCAGLKDLSEAEITELRDCKEKSGIILTAGYGPKPNEDISSEDPSIVENAFQFWKETFPVLKKLDIHQVGGGLYSCWPADYSKKPDKKGDLSRSIKNMIELANMAQEYEIELGMEVLNRHEGYLINTVKECLDYVDAVGRENVKVMLDTYHMSMEEDSLEDAILSAGKKLGHFHIGENNRKLPGQGKIVSWNEIGKALKEIGYTGTVVMEPFVICGGEVGQDIRIWRDLKEDCSEQTLDQEAAESLKFIRRAFEGI
ncbi:MAG: sugar phosphate isomerase/epimerase [Lachnospiraceae bacterium]|nr:sugar phosphate isomerase/epimerase [Lachnospiraceae bacterium]